MLEFPNINSWKDWAVFQKRLCTDEKHNFKPETMDKLNSKC